MSVPALPGEVSVHDDPDAVAAAAAEWLARLCEPPGVFQIALAGGTTPKRLYHLLAAPPLRDRIDWSRWQVWFGDERACPPGDPSSNFAMATSSLLDHVPIAEDAVHRMEAERSDLDRAAAEYSSLLASTCPRLDCVLLGLGENGHTASLFPGTAALDVTDALATRGLADYEPFDRLTLTFPAINAARSVAFLVTGAAKREALAGVAAGTVPAARVRPAGELRWFLDRDAAGP